MMIEKKSVHQFLPGLRTEEVYQGALMNVKKLMQDLLSIKYGRETTNAIVVTYLTITHQQQSDVMSNATGVGSTRLCTAVTDLNLYNVLKVRSYS